jgi:hypothetical protein
MRFQKRIKLFPGVRLNLSKGGISTTIGVPGAGLTVGKRGVYANVGIPGSGISHRQKLGGGGSGKLGRTSRSARAAATSQPAPAAPIKSASPEQATSPGLKDLRETLRQVYAERAELAAARRKAVRDSRNADRLLLISRCLIVGFVVGWFKEFSRKRRETIARVDEAIEACRLDVGIDWNQELRARWDALDLAFSQLGDSGHQWDFTARRFAERVPENCTASSEIVRVPIDLSTGAIPNVVGEQRALRFGNANGPDLYLYPGFLMLLPAGGVPGIVDIREVQLGLKNLRFIEDQRLAPDAHVVDQAWFKSNKDGSRDRRFKNNYQLPVVQYASLHLASPGGVNEVFCFSDDAGAARFAAAFEQYRGFFASVP